MKLRGTEALTLEVGASIPLARTRERVPARFELEESPEGEARGSLLLFRMTGLVMEALPFPSFDYSEALWRVSVRFEGKAASFAVACDIDHPIVRMLVARFIKHRTRAAKIIASEGRWKVDGSAKGLLELGVSIDGSGAGGTSRAPDPETPVLRRVFVSVGSRVYEIPWGEVAPSRVRTARITVTTDTLASSTFGDGTKIDATAILHRGRVHLCASAHRI